MKFITGLLSFLIVGSALAQPAIPKIQRSATRTLTTNAPPIITRAPVSQVVTQGNTATFSVSATLPGNIKGPKPQLKYQWSVKSPNGTTTNVITTATNSTLKVPKAQYANQGQYFASVSYAGSASALSVATLTVPTTNILAGCITTNIQGVAWDYNLTNDIAVTQFKVYWGTSSNSLTSTQYVDAPNLSTTISNLLAGNTYFVQATAVNNSGKESPPSIQISKAFGTGCGGIPFTIDIMMLTNNTPRLTTKLCPVCLVTVYRSTNLITWITIGAAVADQYGNIIFDDHNAPANYGFYRMSTTP